MRPPDFLLSPPALEDETLSATESPSVSAVAPRARRAVVAWLLLTAALVFAVAILGGITRLNHAGLSIVNWEPLAGILPPLTDTAWKEEFEHYRQFPEYRLIHNGMDLAGFQAIYWLEFSHRLLARLVGVVFAVPFLVLLLARQLNRAFAWKLFAVLVLGGLQGALGWYMVASGLVERPDVSHYRLAAHLGLALFLYAALLWLAFLVWLPEPTGWGLERPRGLRRAAIAAAVLVFLMALSGALVAGLDAGLVYNTFPRMDGEWVPAGVFAGNPFDSIEEVQFLHRWLGVVVAAVLILLWRRALDSGLPRGGLWAFHALVAILVVQGLLGILTLLYAVPILLAAAHQAGALLLLAAAVAAAYVAGMVRVRSAPDIMVVG